MNFNSRKVAVTVVSVATGLVMLSAVIINGESAGTTDKNSGKNHKTAKYLAVEQISGDEMADISAREDILVGIADATATAGQIAKDSKSAESEAGKEETTEAVAQTPAEIQEQAAQPSPYENKFMVNVSEYLNIRSEQSEDSQVVGKLYAGCKGSLLEKKDGWTKISSGEVVGYVKDEYIKYGELAKQLADESNLIVTVKTETLRVRQDASEESEILGLVAEGDDLVVSSSKEFKNNWILVDFDDAQGYVCLDYVELKYSFGSAVTIEEEMAARAAIEAETAKEQASESESKSGATQGKATSLSSDDVSLLAAIIQCEAGNESFEGKVAVGNVILNRVNSGSYPGSIYAVITAPGQFPPATNGTMTNVIASGISSSCIQAAQTAMSGTNYVGSATHFRSVSSGYTGTVIGNHVFW